MKHLASTALLLCLLSANAQADFQALSCQDWTLYGSNGFLDDDNDVAG